MIIEPKIKGFICITAHPTGCAQQVQQQIDYVKQHAGIEGVKNVLVIGASTGYGLATRIAAAFGGNAKTLGVVFERPASGKRTASAGWYNTAAFEEAAEKQGLYARTINGDAFSNEIKQYTIDVIKEDLDGQVDLVVYSLASPRRTDPETGQVYNSTLKPLGETYHNKTVDVMKGKVSDITIEPAGEDDIKNTIKVMGGEDWALWIEALLDANLLANDATTVAYSYIGPEMTYPIYRQGTIGKAKEDLESTAQQLNDLLKRKINGKAFISVNKALVTQSSAAIPVVPLYISLLYKVMKQVGTHEGCIEQMTRMLQAMYQGKGAEFDKQGRLRLDDKEMQPDIQQAVSKLWQQVNTDNLPEISDIKGYRDEFHQLFGFCIDTVDYKAEVDPNVSISAHDVTVMEN